MCRDTSRGGGRFGRLVKLVMRLGPVLAMKCFLADVMCSHHGMLYHHILESAVSSGLGLRFCYGRVFEGHPERK